MTAATVDPRLAPIAFFAFNRPEHARRALEALKANPLAVHSQLYIYCDGPRVDETPGGRERIEETRRAVAADQWCGEVTITERPSNLGLRDGLPAGITEVLGKHDRIIVVEDDVIVSPGFLEYLNCALDLYADNDEVMHLSAFVPPVDIPAGHPETTFFYNHTTCWGWATWRRAWVHYSSDGRRLMREIDESGRKRYINLDGAHEYYWALRYLDSGRSQDWNCYWHVSVSLKSGLCLHPVQSLTENIGFDGSGTQCGERMEYTRPHVTQSIPIRPIPIAEHHALRRELTRRPISLRLQLRLKSAARHLLFGMRDHFRKRTN